MIVYVFNQPFPEDSGFGRRCQREIEALSDSEKVTVVCRQLEGQKAEESIFLNGNQVRILRFHADSEIVHRPTEYKSNGMYELKRNVDLLMNLIKTLFDVLTSEKHDQVHLYCVTSPLTVPLLGLFLAKILRIEPTLVSFHDLEPELAMHLKNLTNQNWLVKVEYFLEKIVCRSFKKILVTTEGQAEVLSKRTHVPMNKFCSIVNTTDISAKEGTLPAAWSSFVKPNSFVVTYMSTISFDYTIKGFLSFLKALSTQKDELEHLRVMVLGDGEGLKQVKDAVQEYGLENIVKCFGHVSNPQACLEHSDAAIIPWQQDIMTETMLPTKLFEYLSFGVPVIAPDFGEFHRVLTDKKTAFLTTSKLDMVSVLRQMMSDSVLRDRVGQSGKDLFISTYKPELLNAKLKEFCFSS